MSLGGDETYDVQGDLDAGQSDPVRAERIERFYLHQWFEQIDALLFDIRKFLKSQAALPATPAEPAGGVLAQIVEKARLVSQWHGAMNTGPLEVLDAELGELRALVTDYEGET